MIARIVTLPSSKPTVGFGHIDQDTWQPGEVRTWVPSKKKGKKATKLKSGKR